MAFVELRGGSAIPNCTEPIERFAPVGRLRVEILLLRQVDRHLRLLENVAARLLDPRVPERCRIPSCWAIHREILAQFIASLDKPHGALVLVTWLAKHNPLQFGNSATRQRVVSVPKMIGGTWNREGRDHDYGNEFCDHRK